MAALELLLYQDEFLLDLSNEFILYEDASSLDCCCGLCVCECDILQGHWEITGQLKAVWEFPPECFNPTTEHNLQIGSIIGPLEECIVWQAGVLFTNFGAVNVRFICVDNSVAMTLEASYSACKFTTVTLISFTCDPFEAVFEVQIESNDQPLDPCAACDGLVATVTVTLA